MLHLLCPGLVLVIVMVGRVFPLFGMTFGPAIQVPYIVNRGVASLESVCFGLAYYSCGIKPSPITLKLFRTKPDDGRLVPKHVVLLY